MDSRRVEAMQQPTNKNTVENHATKNDKTTGFFSTSNQTRDGKLVLKT